MPLDKAAIIQIDATIIMGVLILLSLNIYLPRFTCTTTKTVLGQNITYPVACPPSPNPSPQKSAQVVSQPQKSGSGLLTAIAAIPFVFSAIFSTYEEDNDLRWGRLMMFAGFFLLLIIILIIALVL